MMALGFRVSLAGFVESDRIPSRSGKHSQPELQFFWSAGGERRKRQASPSNCCSHLFRHYGRMRTKSQIRLRSRAMAGLKDEQGEIDRVTEKLLFVVYVSDRKL